MLAGSADGLRALVGFSLPRSAKLRLIIGHDRNRVRRSSGVRLALYPGAGPLCTEITGHSEAGHGCQLTALLAGECLRCLGLGAQAALFQERRSLAI